MAPAGNVRIRGVDVPLTAVVGGLGTFGAFVVAMALDPVVLATGGGWMIVGTLLYVALPPPQGPAADRDGQGRDARRRSGSRRSSTERPGRLRRGRPVLRGGGGDGQGARRGAPARDPRPLAGQRARPTCRSTRSSTSGESAARTKIEQAKLICGQRVTGSVAAGAAWAAGQAIVDEARSIKAAAIVMPLRYRNGAPLYGKTLQTVLAKRPCRVIVAANPGEAAEAWRRRRAGRRLRLRRGAAAQPRLQSRRAGAATR